MSTAVLDKPKGSGVTASGPGAPAIMGERPSAADLVRTPEVIIGDRPRGTEDVQSAIPDVDLERLIIEGEKLAKDVRAAITGGDGITRTMDGASTVTFDVIDPSGDVMQTGIFEQGAEMEIDGVGFVLVGLDRTGDIVTTTWEDREINWLRQYDKPIKAWKDKVTRGQFIHYLVKEPTEGAIKFWCPEERHQLPGDAADARALRKVDHPAARSGAGGGKGSTSQGGGRIRAPRHISGFPLSGQKLQDYNTCMLEALRLGATRQVMVDMTVAGWGESTWDRHATEHVYGTHHGIFQSYLIPGDQVKKQAHYFLVGGHSFRAGGAIGYRKHDKNASHGFVAAHIEISDGSAGYYNQFTPRSIAMVKRWLHHVGAHAPHKKIATTPQVQGAAVATAAKRNAGSTAGGILAGIDLPPVQHVKRRGKKKKHTKNPSQSSIDALVNVALGQANVGAFVDAGVKALGGNREVLPDARVKKLAYQRGYDGKLEDSWTCIKRLCSEPGVNWNAFMVNGWIYVVSDAILFSLAVQVVINRDTPGVHDIDYHVDTGKRVQEVNISCQAERWALPPGSHVLLDEENDPAIFGDWLVQEINRPMFSSDASVTLRRAHEPTFAPKSKKSQLTFAQRSATVGGGSKNPRHPAGNVSTGNKITDRVLKKAIQISKRNLPYVWGGGHGSFSANGYDCSGYVSACLHAAGLLNSPLTSGALEGWGKHGHGKFFTVYCSSVHTFIVFHKHPHGIYRADTSPHGSGGNGPHVRFGPRSHAGFVPRHWPGC